MSIFIIGAGSRVGYGIAEKFKAEGYKVAVGSRSPDFANATAEGFLPITIDAGKVECIEQAFAEVAKSFGGPPNVVVYNAVSLLGFPDPTNAFAVNVDDFSKDASVNIIGAYAAIKEAVAGFRSLDGGVAKVFISTGNILPFKPMAIGTGLGTGKASQAHLMSMGPLSYGSQGIRFYYASQVTDGGDTVEYPELSGEAHGNAYLDIVRRKDQGDWQVNFTPDGKTYGRVV